MALSTKDAPAAVLAAAGTGSSAGGYDLDRLTGERGRTAGAGPPRGAGRPEAEAPEKALATAPARER